MKYFLPLFICLSSLDTFGQRSDFTIEMERIPQQKIRDFIEKNYPLTEITFESFKPSVASDEPYLHLRKHTKSFRFRIDADQSWATYLQANPDYTWNGKKVSFGLMISKPNKEIIYKNGHFEGFQVGQICFIQIKVLRGHEKLAVAFEVIEINPTNKEIKFSYLEGGKSKGIQTIKISGTKKGFAKIDHITYYQSDSKFRDRFLYPYFHSKVLREYHGNMRKIAIEKTDKPKLKSS
jgi:hypothetical protein